VADNGVPKLSVQERIESVARADGRWIIPPALPAATVVLARPHRESPTGFDVVMLRRASSMQFAAHMAVFPGGKVDPVDHGAPDPFVACAIREVNEEVGINVEQLIHWDHWITPEIEPMRYDVHFYLAVVDSDVIGELRTSEANEMLWLTPREGIRRSLDGSLKMLRPTQAVLEELTQSHNVEHLLQSASEKSVIPRLPRPVLLPDQSIRWDLVDAASLKVSMQDVGAARMESTGEQPE
jgi:8-oxo-dGTP pyrophosphatase MutT (NUDIX family)